MSNKINAGLCKGVRLQMMGWVGLALLWSASASFAERGNSHLSEAVNPNAQLASRSHSLGASGSASQDQTVAEQDVATYRWRTVRPISQKFFASEQAGCLDQATLSGYESCMRLQGYRLVGR